MKKTSFIVAGVLITGIAIASSLFATTDLSSAFERGTQRDPAQFEAAQKAIEAKDYNAWKTAVGDNKMAENITETNFAKFIEMHEAMKNGDKEAAKKLREELGIQMPAKGFGKGKDEPTAEQKAQRDAEQKAIEAKDYNAWKTAIGDNKMTEKIDTEAKFARFVEMKDYMKKAEEIRKELGLEQGFHGQGGMMKQGMKKMKGFMMKKGNEAEGEAVNQ